MKGIDMLDMVDLIYRVLITPNLCQFEIVVFGESEIGFMFICDQN